MATATQAYKPSDIDVAAVRDLDAAVYRMVMAIVGKNGSIAAPYPQTLAFQTLWNASKGTINRVSMGLAGKQLWFSLVEDGLYGKNTGKALSLITGVQTPLHTADIPKWYLTNKKLIDSYAKALPSSTAAHSAATVAAAKQAPVRSPTTSVTQNNNAVVASVRSGAAARANVPTQTSTAAPKGTVVSQTSRASQANSAWAITVGQAKVVSGPSAKGSSTKPPAAISAKAAAAGDIAKMTTDLSFDDEQVPVAKPKSNLLVFGLGAAAFAAAGVFGYMVYTQRKHHRRAA